MPALLDKLEADHETAVANGWRTDFDPNMKWDSVFKAAVEDLDMWWRTHIEDPGLEINCGVHAPSHYTDGDAMISRQPGVTPTGSDSMATMPAASGGHPLTNRRPGYEEPPSGPPSGGRRKRNRGLTRGFGLGEGAPPVKINRTKESFCAGFQKGECTQACTDGLHCARDPSKTHRCSYCRKTGHGAERCWSKPQSGKGQGDRRAERNLPWAKPTGGKGKDKGKTKGGGKNKNNWG